MINTKKSLIIYVNQIFSLLCGLVNTYVITRAIIPEDLGSFRLIQNIVFIFFFITTSGYSSLTFKKIAISHNDRQKYFSTNLFIDLFFGIFATFLFIILALGNYIDLGETSTALIFLVLFEIFVRRIFVENLFNVFNAKNQIEKVQISVLVQTILSSLLIILVVRFSKNIEVLALVYFIKSVIGLLIILYYLILSDMKIKIKMYPEIISKFWLFTKPLLFSIILTVLYTNLGPILVGYYSGTNELGLFSVAKKFNVMVLAVSASVTTIVFSNFSNYIENNDAIRMATFSKKVTKYISIIVLFVIGAIIIFSDILMHIFIGEDYYNSKALIIMFMVPVYFTSLSRTISTALWASEDTKNIAMINVVTRTLGLITLILLIPKEINNFELLGFGAMGIIISHSIVGLISIIMTIYYNWKNLNLSFYYRIFIHIIICSSLIIFFDYLKAYFVNYTSMFFILFPLFSISYFSLLIIFNELKIRDILNIKNSILKV